MGEGVGVFIMETLESVKKRGVRIYVEYFGGVIICDVYYMIDL